MFDKYMIVEKDFKNVKKYGNVTGFQFGMRLPYYRGVVLSLLGETVLMVDGEKIPSEKMTVTLHDRIFALSELENESVEKWEFGEVGILTVVHPGGLQPGAHQIDLKQHMKISYTPTGFWGHDMKTVNIMD